jgi:hypothetical protein
MLREAIEYLILRTVPGARPTGTLTEFISLGARMRRCSPSWSLHLERSRAFYIQSALQTSRRNTCVVLGSGWAADLPLAALTDLFQTVTLVDVAHPLRIRRLQRSLPGLRLVLADITGCLETMGKQISDPNLGNAPPSPDQPVLEERGWLNADMLISANVLSQLGLDAAERWAQRRGNTPEAVKVSSRWQEALQRNHLRQLQKAQGRVALVADRLSQLQSVEGALVEETPMIPPDLLPEPDQTWNWLLAPPCELGRPHRVVHTVGAWTWSQPSNSGD